MFDKLEALPADAILRLIAEYAEDPREEKIDLGVGVYRNEAGETPVLGAVKQAERELVDTQRSKAYVGSGGDPAFNDAMQRLTFADDVAHERVTTLQTPGGSGSLRVAAGLLLRARADTTVWVSDPTWANHEPLLGGAGIRLKVYPYYDRDACALRFDEMLDTIGKIPAGDVVLLHASCHNPTGMDLAREQWEPLSELIAERKLVPFVDMAYQGFADGLDEDAHGVRVLAGKVPELLVSCSCSKNFGLYRDRVGTLSVVSSNAETAEIVRSQTHNIVRTMYSMPPDHGAAVVRSILTDDALRATWEDELGGMRTRLKSMRELLTVALKKEAPDRDFSHIERANGMFSFLGIPEDRVEALKRDFGVYMVGSSRINVAGITPGNVGYLATSIGSVL